jgi:tRNA pseudouridine55 synthase
LRLRIVCSKGTYIRALARDIGVALQSGAHLTSLERTKIGDVTLDNCFEISELLESIEKIVK